ncbi:alpha/beta fold hydrolase [Sphingosinithalassobacter portus]|uniref:alpha/beta fold hydrolase n=1 Tax=Stakelama portus TaxID=2676234 RepID=UPI000D6E806D|nr:alpha/beta hydrolase [Sphingosinithalassobacter portus]
MRSSHPSGPSSGTYVSQRLRLHYNDWGNTDAPPLLLVHGGKDHSRSWDWVANALRDDWHVIAPDLRGHGDSAWSPDGNYSFAAYIYDLAQLVHQLGEGPVTIVAHSLGGAISLRYAGIFPEMVSKLVAIEGTGATPAARRQKALDPIDRRFREWIAECREMSGRHPRRYQTFQQALERMRQANPYLSDEQAEHLTVHAVARNEDGTLSWKFDNYTHSSPPVDLSRDQIERLWSRISCPTLLAWGDRSWAVHPEKDGVTACIPDVRVAEFHDAGHWLHHDRFPEFVKVLRDFLGRGQAV